MTTISLNIDDKGTMTITAGDNGQQVPVASLDEALGMIKELASAAAMPVEGGEEAMPVDQGAPMMEEGQEEAAMMDGYRPGQTGR